MKQEDWFVDNDVFNFRYGCAQTFKLPEKEFSFLSYVEKENIDWEKADLTSGEIGYFVECDMNYPKEIHESTRSFPLCPENITITYDMLSPLQKKCLERIYNRTSYKQRKLTATFLPRKKM